VSQTSEDDFNVFFQVDANHICYFIPFYSESTLFIAK